MDDCKLVKVIDSLGMEGYGIFWGLIELLRNQPDYTYPIESAILKYRQWNTSQEKIKVLILNYDLFILDDNTFYSQSLLNRMSIVDDKRSQFREWGRKGGLQKAKNKEDSTPPLPPLSENVTPPLPIKGKESKGKERKRKEKKGKVEDVEILINYSFEEFWELYDKKVGRKIPLEKKWLSLSDEQRHEIMDYVPDYINAQPNKKFRKNPETFFNSEAWNDEIINNNQNETENAINEAKRKIYQQLVSEDTQQ